MTDTRSAGDALLGAIAYLKAEAGTAAPELPAEYRDLGDQWPVVKPLGNGLSVCYLYDDGEVYSYVQQRDVNALGSSADALHEMALINLARRADGRMRLFHHGAIHGVMLDNQFEASLLLVDEIWEGPARAFAPNGAVAAVPSRGVLLFCDRESAEGLAELRQHLAKGRAAGGIELSDDLLQRDELGNWHRLPE